ncbi:MAG: hypothetical protein HY875_00480 [Chloroflexi bacterium]|nr:hypothetical protein [Chloroflexota bacterium]
MFASRHRGIVAVVAGVLIAAAHVALGIAAVVSAQQWLSGMAIGLIVAAAAGLHLAPAHLWRVARRRTRD